jgi:hypothetical protein
VIAIVSTDIVLPESFPIELEDDLSPAEKAI